MENLDNISGHFTGIGMVISMLPVETVRSIYLVLLKSKKAGRRVFLIGNGGSAATASHLACDLQKMAGVRAIALTDSSLLTALGNDAGYEMTFVTQLANLADPGDVLIAISSSGTSPNIVHAAVMAKRLDMDVLGLTGGNGGRLAELCWGSVIVPGYDVQQIEDAHLIIGHAIIKQLAGYNGEVSL